MNSLVFYGLTFIQEIKIKVDLIPYPLEVHDLIEKILEDSSFVKSSLDPSAEH